MGKFAAVICALALVVVSIVGAGAPAVADPIGKGGGTIELGVNLWCC